jgi:hypothetical protein
MRNAAAIALCTLAFWTPARAEIIGLDLGTDAPPATLGPWEISALPLDTRPYFTDVLDAPGSPPLSADVLFGAPMSKRSIGYGWGSWSHGYTGAVYYSNGRTAETLNLPAGTAAFLFYLDPLTWSGPWFTATAQDGTSVTVRFWGAGDANGFAFYGTDGDTVTSIAVTGDAAFAWGEFYGAQIPEPAMLSLAGIAGLAARPRR